MNRMVVLAAGCLLAACGPSAEERAETKAALREAAEGARVAQWEAYLRGGEAVMDYDAAIKALDKARATAAEMGVDYGETSIPELEGRLDASPEIQKRIDILYDGDS